MLKKVYFGFRDTRIIVKIQLGETNREWEIQSGSSKIGTYLSFAIKRRCKIET